LAKRTEGSSGWNKPPQVLDAYSVNDCVNDNFADFVDYWKHSCWWFFDSPEVIQKWGKSWLLGRGKGRVAHDRVFGFGTNARKIASGGKRGYIGLQPKGKSKIPSRFERCLAEPKEVRFACNGHCDPDTIVREEGMVLHA
jgi:hypothetical protein